MDSVLKRQLLIAEYHSLMAILEERGVSVDFPSLSIEALKDLETADLSAIVRTLRSLARTPSR